MVNATHQRLAQTATRLVSENGRVVRLIPFGLPDGSRGPRERGNEIAVIAVQTKFESSEIDGDLIRVDDLCFLIDNSVELDNNMRLRDGDTEYSIYVLTLVKPGELEVFNKVRARL